MFPGIGLTIPIIYINSILHYAHLHHREEMKKRREEKREGDRPAGLEVSGLKQTPPTDRRVCREWGRGRYLNRHDF